MEHINTSSDEPRKESAAGETSVIDIMGELFIRQKNGESVTYVSLDDEGISYEDYEEALSAVRKKKEQQMAILHATVHGGGDKSAGGDLVKSIISFLKPIVKLENAEEYVLLAIYCIMTFCYKMFERIPYINLTGPTGSGKTTLMKAMMTFSFNPQFFSDTTDAVLFRVTNKKETTLFLDEVENLGSSSNQNIETFKIINSGYEKAGKAARVINGETVEFSTYGPKVLGAIKRLIPTIENRCHVINMTPREESAAIQVKDALAVKAESEQVKYLISLWIRNNAKSIHQYTSRKEDIYINPFIKNRDLDKWYPILVLAKLLSTEGKDYEKIINNYARQVIIKNNEAEENKPESVCKRLIVEYVNDNRDDKMKVLRKDKKFYYVNAEAFTDEVSEKDMVNSYTGQCDVTKALKKAGITANRQRFRQLRKDPSTAYRVPIELVEGNNNSGKNDLCMKQENSDLEQEASDEEADMEQEKILRHKSSFGTHQWADDSLNFIAGCIHDCSYCYSKEMAVRFNQMTADEWKDEKVREKDLNKKIKKFDKRVMFPSSHDIHPVHLKEATIFLKHILEAGNEVLIVTKPHLECIKEICSKFQGYKDKILFRFTIGSADDETLKFWELNAPDFNERLESLKWAHREGFQTSVSCEPMLDGNIDKVVDAVSPFVTETIWIGKINHLLGIKGRGRLDFNGHNDPVTLGKADELIALQSDENIMALYEKYKNNPIIRWKESVQRVIRKNS